MIAVLAGAVWWWATARLLWWPATTGPVESAVAAGGWGLSLLPVHCVPWAGRRRPRGGGARGPGLLSYDEVRAAGADAVRGVLWGRLRKGPGSGGEGGRG
ncbi:MULTISPECIES: hypothetical protein [Streptomyces]|uniref:Integral membrane protein n=1 Tax=Streptomyces ramulosus TaxID=47762 RepID=A0ABW1FUJ7_9ACTN